MVTVCTSGVAIQMGIHALACPHVCEAHVKKSSMGNLEVWLVHPRM